jgi:dolichol-phosphate mannosyltransferase
MTTETSATPRTQLVAIVPTYNEAANLETCVTALLALHTPGVELRVLVVDDASPDGTGRIADRLAQSSEGRVSVIHRQGKGGLGSACLTGFSAALRDGAGLIAQIDADLSHDPATLPEILERIGQCDLVVGSRYVEGGYIDPRWAWHRRALSELGNRFVPYLLGLPIHDATSGYRLWRREALERIDPFHRVASSGYGFQVEMCLLAHRLGLRIEEVPIEFTERGQGRSKMTTGVKLASVRDILALRWRHGGARRLGTQLQTDDGVAGLGDAGSQADGGIREAVRFIAHHKRYWLVPLVLAVLLVVLLAVLSSSGAPPLHYTLY